MILVKRVDDGEKETMRTALEMQFRYKFYQDTTFPYLQSLGIRDIFQGFGNDEQEFIGMLHLWWVPEESNIHYDNPKKFPVKILGVWKAEWFDTPQEGLALAEKIENDKPYNVGMMMEEHRRYHEKLKQIQMKKMMEERTMEEEIEEEAKKVTLWN